LELAADVFAERSPPLQLAQRLAGGRGEAFAEVRQAVREEVDRVQPLRSELERGLEGGVHVRVPLRRDRGQRLAGQLRAGRRVVGEPLAFAAQRVEDLVGEQDQLEVGQLRQAALDL